MSNENRIKFEEAMPKFYQRIAVKFTDGEVAEATPVKQQDHKGRIINFVLYHETKDEINLEKLSGWRPLKSENDKANDWTLFEDKLPELGEKIEISVEETEDPIECRLVVFESEGFVLTDNINEYRFDPYTYRKWRYKKERRPDFTKLKKEDLILINDVICGYFFKIDKEAIYHSNNIGGTSADPTYKSFIKKIIRINIEEKTFEEI